MVAYMDKEVEEYDSSDLRKKIDIPEDVLMNITNKKLVEELEERINPKGNISNSEFQMILRHTLDAGIMIMPPKQQ